MNGTPTTLPPREIELDRAGVLRITWADGQRSDLPLAEVRRACPCATCRQERQTRPATTLRVVAPTAAQADMVRAENIELVGQYAVRLTWKDGHATGIYEFASLRDLADAVAGPGAGARPRSGSAAPQP